MPKETFFNLPEEKRNKIIDIAIEEFAMYDYKTASLSRIVAKAEIAKGSMYQYFENKKDLYLYLINMIAEIKLNTITRSLNVKQNDFFELFKEINLQAAKFDLSHLTYSRLMYNAMREAYNEEIGDISLQMLKKSDDYLKDFVFQAQMSGQLRSDIATDLIAFLISRISINMVDYVSNKFNFSYTKTITEGKNSLPVSDDQISSLLDDLIKFFKSGLQVQ